MITGTSTANNTSISETTTSGPPAAWLRTKENSTNPAEMTYATRAQRTTSEKAAHAKPRQRTRSRIALPSNAALAATSAIGSASGGRVGKYAAMNTPPTTTRASDTVASSAAGGYAPLVALGVMP